MTTTLATKTGRWKLVAQIDGDTVRLVFNEFQRVLGVLSMSHRAYRSFTKDMIVGLVEVAQRSIGETLGKRLWDDAQSQTLGLDAEAARMKLESFGWTQEKVNNYARELAVALSQQLVELLPGGRG